ncbi:DNA-binding protein [Orbaceae bacterium ESL0721]|nr:DNA-binding protein [Orbaceae bacterium ESL0721]
MKEWFSPKELTDIEGLPSTTQGVNRKARVEHWTARKRMGVRGKALEYHIGSLPKNVKDILIVKEEAASYVVSPIEPLQLWITAFEQLTKEEQATVTSWLMRNGIKDFMVFINETQKDS